MDKIKRNMFQAKFIAMSNNTNDATSWISDLELEEAAQTSSATESKTSNNNNEESKTPSLESKTPDPESKTPIPEDGSPGVVDGAGALPPRYNVTVEDDKVKVEEVTNSGEATLELGNEVAEVKAVDQLAKALNKVCKE